MSNGGFADWLERRLPVAGFIREHLSRYYAPKNLNFWYYFGSLAMLVFGMQILTGIFLTMHYKPDSKLAFESVELIMRDVNWGWLVRYMHSTGASAFFIIIYLHMFRGLIYGSYKQPRELIWIIGICIYLALMAEAFMGYLLPWGQMSYWGAQVIVNLFGAIPYIGEGLAIWIRGDYVVSDATLNRFFAFHVISVPLVLIGLIVLHIVALHRVGSNNPQGVEVWPINRNAGEVKDAPSKGVDKHSQPYGTIAFHPFYTIKDMMGAVFFFILFSLVVFYAPEMGGFFLESNNFVKANPLVTPDHITPLWYFTPFYTVLRAIPDPWYGVLGMGGAVLIWFFVPWIDRNPIKSIRYRSPAFRLNLLFFVIAFLALGYLGLQEVNPFNTELALRFSEIYFIFFAVLWILNQIRTRWYRFIFFAVVLGLICLYDAFRLGVGVSGGLVFSGFGFVLLYMFVLFIVPMFTDIAKDYEERVPVRVD